MRRSPRWLPLAAALVGALLVGCTDDSAGPAGSGSTGSDPAGADLPATDLADCPQFPAADAPVDGGLPLLVFPCLAGASQLSFGGPVGQPMVLNLWASWCGPCREELPIFERLYDEAADQVLVVGLVQRDTSRSSLAYAAELDLGFPSGLDDTGQWLTEVGRNALPITYFVNADGTLAHEQLIPITSYDELTALIAEHLDVTVS